MTQRVFNFRIATRQKCPAYGKLSSVKKQQLEAAHCGILIELVP